jgi:hypothetical protein
MRNGSNASASVARPRDWRKEPHEGPPECAHATILKTGAPTCRLNKEERHAEARSTHNGVVRAVKGDRSRLRISMLRHGLTSEPWTCRRGLISAQLFGRAHFYRYAGLGHLQHRSVHVRISTAPPL